MATTTKWRSAIDPKSGRTYYYHVETRETQWRKPTELATPAERQEMEEKEQQQRDFFATMEANILKSITEGVYNNATQKEAAQTSITEQKESDEVSIPPTQPLARPNLVRTISTMEDSVLVNLVQRVPSTRNLLLLRSRQSSEIFKPRDTEQRPRLASTASSRLSLRSIDERAAIIDMDEEDSSDDGLKVFGEHFLSERTTSSGTECSIDLPAAFQTPTSSYARQASFGQLLADLPKEGSVRSLLSSDRGALEESTWSFRMDPEESQVLEELARVTDQMSMLLDTNNGDDALLPNRQSLILTDITEADEGTDNSGSSSSLWNSSIDNIAKRGYDAAIAMPREELTQRSVGHLRVPSLAVQPLEEEKEVVPSLPTRDPLFQSAEQSSAASSTPKKPAMVRRNTCGTLYVGSTMANPDKDATIKCVCAVYRAHIVQSMQQKSPANNDEEYRVFHDLRVTPHSLPSPSLDDISAFYRDIFQRAQMEADCIIISLIYVERLIKATEGALRPRPGNWRSLLFSCMVLSSKVWDDMSVWNADFSRTCPSGVKFTLQRINQLEVSVLTALNYEVKVPASEYAKYYFLLRSMLIKSGLGSESVKMTNPLDVKGAERLQSMSARFQTSATSDGDNFRGKLVAQRSRSVGSVVEPQDCHMPKNKVGLEHVVKM